MSIPVTRENLEKAFRLRAMAVELGDIRVTPANRSAAEEVVRAGVADFVADKSFVRVRPL